LVGWCNVVGILVHNAKKEGRSRYHVFYMA